MTESTKSKILYSPLAEARWAYLIDPRPQLEPGKPLAWTCDLIMPKDDPRMIAFDNKIEEIFVAEHGTKRNRSEKGYPIKPDKKDPSKQVIKFKSQQNQKSDGTFWPGPTIIDARKQPWDGSAIGNGSKLIIAFSVNPWVRPEGVGITLIPKSAQVVHLVPYVQDDGVDGFDEQEGYTVPGTGNEPPDEWPF